MKRNTNAAEPTFTVRILPNTGGSPAAKLADGELIFASDGGLLSGLKLVGFAIWEGRNGERNVTFPARPFVANGERRSYTLLRPVNGQELGTYDAFRRVVLQAYDAYAESVVSQVSRDTEFAPGAETEEGVL